MSRHWQLSRRAFLRGAGAAVGLPLLDAMLPAKVLAGQAPAQPPVRMACVFFPNGVWQDAWIPKQTGSDYDLPFALEPLRSVKDDVLVLSGLDKANSRSGDGHYAKTANFLTGMPVEKTTGRDISSGGISVDQLAAKRKGHLTPLPSLELGTEPVISGVDSNVGYTRLYGSYISWQSPSRPVAKEIDPRLVYQRLFGGGASFTPDHANLLDFVLEDARDLRKRLGRDDQGKLDEYLDSVRSVEKRIEFHSKPDPRAWRPNLSKFDPQPPGAPDNFRERIRLMLDMIVLAMQTDSTRISTFMFANSVSGRDFSFLDGVRGGHHPLSHHQNDAKKIEQYKRINRWHAEQFAYMLEKMRAVREGEGTLLDNAMILFGCGMSDGNRHDPNNLPILLGGRGGGTIRSGRHVASPKNTPLCNLYVSMLDRMGVEVHSFGDSTGPLTAIDAAPPEARG